MSLGLRQVRDKHVHLSSPESVSYLLSFWERLTGWTLFLILVKEAWPGVGGWGGGALLGLT